MVSIKVCLYSTNEGNRDKNLLAVLLNRTNDHFGKEKNTGQKYLMKRKKNYSRSDPYRSRMWVRIRHRMLKHSLRSENKRSSDFELHFANLLESLLFISSS